MKKITINFGNKVETFQTFHEGSVEEGKRFAIALGSMVSSAFMGAVTDGLILARKNSDALTQRIVDENK